MKIRALIGIAGSAYTFSRGVEYDVTDEVGNDLVKAGHAIEIKTEERATVAPKENGKARREGNKGR